MGANKKIGISKEYRDIAEKYAYRFRLVDYQLILSRTSGKRVIYLIGTDIYEIIYRIRFDKVRRFRRPKGIQVVNRKDYLIHQAEQIYGVDAYDYSLIEDSDITFSNKLNIICREHGVFKKRKAAFITQGEGCPHCAKIRFNNNRRYDK